MFLEMGNNSLLEQQDVFPLDLEDKAGSRQHQNMSFSPHWGLKAHWGLSNWCPFVYPSIHPVINFTVMGHYWHLFFLLCTFLWYVYFNLQQYLRKYSLNRVSELCIWEVYFFLKIKYNYFRFYILNHIKYFILLSKYKLHLLNQFRTHYLTYYRSIL